MEIIATPIKGCFVVNNRLFKDERGYFFESFNHQIFSHLTGWKGQFVQDNQSESQYGVVRGLHAQKGLFAQAKLVRVLKGKVLDVVLDTRPESESFGVVFAKELSDENDSQMFVPRGCLHGFSVLTPFATFFYKCDNYYNKLSEVGINPLDTTLNIDWQIPASSIILSDKDKVAESWETFAANFKTVHEKN